MLLFGPLLSLLLITMGFDHIFKLTGIADAKDAGLKLTEIKEFVSNQTGGVDVAVLTHKAMKAMDDSDIIELAIRMHGGVSDFVTTKAVRQTISSTVARFVNFANKLGVRLVAISDGKSFPGKEAEDEKRDSDRKNHFNKALTLQKAVQSLQTSVSLMEDRPDSDAEVAELGARLQQQKKAMMTSFANSLYRHDHLVALTLQAFRDKGVTKAYLAVHEADSQLAYMSITKQVDFLFVEDSDYLAYGAKRCLFGGLNLSYNSKTQKYKVAFCDFDKDVLKLHSVEVNKTVKDPANATVTTQIKSAETYDLTGFTPIAIQLMASLIGCDYTRDKPSIKGYGKVQSYKVAAEFSRLLYRPIV
jgi:5'-3' exonuclease